MVRIGYGTRVGRSIGGMLFGLILFLSSFGVIYWNEGRINGSDVAGDAIEVSADEAAPSEAEGQLVALSGKIHSDETLGDGQYVNAGDYLAISSTPEIYAWVENSKTTSKKNLGGSEDVETTYSYKQDWVTNAADSSQFNEPAGHENVGLYIDPVNDRVDSATIGDYELNFDQLELAGYEPLSLNEGIVSGVSAIDDKESTTISGGKYIYMGKGAINAPQVGDVRISYRVVPNDIDATILGKLDGNKITTFRSDEGNFYRMFMGSKDDALEQLDSEFSFALWAFRALGFVMMWFGLGMLLAPLSTVLDVVPMFGSASRSIVGGLTLVLSLLLTALAIFLSKLIHNVWILIAGVVVALLLFLYMKKGKGGPVTKIKI